MYSWFKFVYGNKRLLNFGFLFNFFSSFGQTFFISLFVPFWVQSFEISNTAFGSIYAFVTIISAFLLSYTGRFIDRMSLRKFGMLVFSGLLVSTLFLSQAYHVWMLMPSLLLVRWFGQGMMTHTSATGIAKIFDEHRGKALGFTALGHPAGQFFLPLLVTPLIFNFGWRFSLLILIALAAMILFPTIYSIGSVTKIKTNEKKQFDSSGKEENYLLTWKFWLITSNVFIVPFLTTAVFLYQYTLAESKGWDVSWVTFSFAFFAIFNAISLLVSGHLVDKYTGIKLFPLYLIPALIALILMAIVTSQWIFPLFYGLLGISTGLGSTIKTAMQTEVYGQGKLGKIRSYFSTIIVFSTALGPPAFGYFIDRDYSFNSVMAISAGVMLIVFLVSFKVWSIPKSATHL